MLRFVLTSLGACLVVQLGLLLIWLKVTQLMGVVPGPLLSMLLIFGLPVAVGVLYFFFLRQRLGNRFVDRSLIALVCSLMTVLAALLATLPVGCFVSPSNCL